jgi:hypothetical protein
MNLNCLELLALITAGAVAPYVFVALITWLQRSDRPSLGADAPMWFRFLKLAKRKDATRCAA